MRDLRFLALALAAVLLAPAAPAQLLIYKGTIKQTETGQGASEKLNANCYVVIDYATANIAQIQYTTVGKTKTFSTSTDTNYHIVKITGLKGKNIEALARRATSCDTDSGKTSETVLAQGTDSSLLVDRGVTLTFPKTLSGTANEISYDGSSPAYVTTTLVLGFDAVQTPLSNENGESLDIAVSRLSGLLQNQGYTQEGQSLPASGSPLILTNDTMVTTWSDSFGRAQFGQRQNFFLGSYFINYHPQHFVSYRDHSRAGASNFEMLTQRVPMYGIPDAGASYGKTNGLNIFYVSGNGDYDSNSIYGYFKSLLQFPTKSYTFGGAFTQDWSQPKPQSLYSSIVIGDVPYNSGSENSRDYSYGARSAATQAGVPFIDTWNNMINVVTNNDSLLGTLWFPNGGAYDHPNNVFQLIWTLTNLRSLGVDSNAYTAVIDFNATKVSATNHCIVTGLSRNGNSLSFTFHADRMAPGFYVPDGVITNDCRGAFSLMPTLGNQFCEIFRVTNLPQGNYELNIDGSNVVTVSSAQFSAGYNNFTNYSGAFWAQKKEVLGLMCDMADISRADASSNAHPSDLLLNERYESDASGCWPTNTLGVDKYISLMSANESLLQSQDVLIHAAAQQTNHIVTISQLP